MRSKHGGVALLVALAALPSAQAAVQVNGKVGGQSVLCAAASGISYTFSTNTLRFTCDATGLRYVCQPDGAEAERVRYLTGTAAAPNPTLSFSCSSGEGTGLIVAATIDATLDRCPVSSNVTYARVASGNKRFSWTCNQVAKSCYPTGPIAYALNARTITLACSGTDEFLFTDDFE
jgi:hypothetical protein